MTIEPRRLTTAAETALAARFAARDFSGEPAALAERRRAAFAAFGATGLPNRRVEAYRYTDLKAALPDLAAAPAAAAVPAGRVWDFGGLAAHRAVFVDGRFDAGLSDLSGLDGAVTVRRLSEAGFAGVGTLAGELSGTGGDPVVQLNTALFDDGVVVDVAAGASVSQPLAIVHVASGAPVCGFSRHVVRVGAGASVRVIEHHSGPDGVAYQASSLVELDIARQARVLWTRLQEDGHRAVSLGGAAIRLGEGAELQSLSVVFGGLLSRNQGVVHFAGPHARAVFETVTLVDGRRLADATLTVDHDVPDCTSRERFRAVIDDAARSVVQGRIEVAQDAQRTDGRMMTQALVIGAQAEAINKPELEIFADDVQCAHGATSGRLDENAVFYLRSRGVPKAEAEALLLEAFLAESIESFADEAVAAVLSQRLRALLAGRRARGTIGEAA